MRAFVIRGSGQQAGIDFERVHAELIGSAFANVGIDDGGTGAIAEDGSVREDMFRELYEADIVVADVSAPNAKIFYVLGIRHVVRPRSTVLISSRINEPPLDLGPDRYLRYDPDFPGESVPQLAQVLRETLSLHDGQAEVGDQVLNAVWRGHRQWSKAADTSQKSLNRWRLSNLALLVLAAVVAAFAAQTWLGSAAVTALAAISAAFLAAAVFIQGSMLTSENTSRWTGARAASEALKAETYRYLAGVKPYAAADRAKRLQAQFDTVQTRSKDLLLRQQLATADDRGLPPVHTFESYREKRGQGQADWHRGKIAEHTDTARKLRFCQLGATAAGAVLAAVAGALPGAHLAAWTAAATTIAAAFATHIAATQHQRIAASYASTADQLQRLVDSVDPKMASADQQAQFVADVERVLAVQNDGWVDLIGTAAKI